MTAITVTELLAAYREGDLDVRAHLGEVMRTIRAADDHHVWIHVLDDAQLEPYLARLEASEPADLPLYGVPFAIKDNIDLEGVPTTAGCPDYAYTPERSAFVVQRLIDAGAVPVGKTNLDQFATGLVGTRSPHGACRNAFDPDYLSGGSSSGSAVAVALGQVGFSLGTDTAGSGRVPAMFNNLVGVKPTRGLLSAGGVVPACRTLDTVSIFALTGPDAERVLDVAARFDEQDAYARPDRVPELGHGAIPATGFRFGVPRREQLAFFGDAENPAHFERASIGWSVSAARRWKSISRRSSRPPDCSTRGRGSPSAMPRSRRSSSGRPTACTRSPGRSSQAARRLGRPRRSRRSTGWPSCAGRHNRCGRMSI